MRSILCGVLLLGYAALLPVQPVAAQAVHQEFQELVKAQVLEVVEESPREVTGTDTTTTVQLLRVELLEGEKEGEVVRFENDLVMLSPGDEIFVNRLVAIDGTEYYTFRDIERRGPLLALFVLFAALVLWLSRWQGLRALVSLGLSFGAIVFLLVPALLKGYSPALTSLVVAALVLSATLFFTHGIKPRVVIAFIGTFGAVVATCLISWLWVTWMQFSGLADDTAVYLNLASGGVIDLAGLLLGGIIVGLLGVLDDVSITQSSVVQELKAANAELGFTELYERALRVGRDHVGSLVNTLALAYAGASLPLLLLYSYSSAPWSIIANQEIIAAEIVRILVGSIGLILAVPFTTALAAWYFSTRATAAHAHASDGHHDHAHHHHDHGHHHH